MHACSAAFQIKRPLPERQPMSWISTSAERRSGKASQFLGENSKVTEIQVPRTEPHQQPGVRNERQLKVSASLWQ